MKPSTPARIFLATVPLAAVIAETILVPEGWLLPAAIVGGLLLFGVIWVALGELD